MLPFLPTLRPPSRPSGIWLLCVVLGFACLGPTPVRAAPAAAPTAAVAAPLFAEEGGRDGWGVKKLMSGMTTRSRIIQIAIVCMCLGLFIMMRKFHA